MDYGSSLGDRGPSSSASGKPGKQYELDSEYGNDMGFKTICSDYME